jgi:uncharacterized repeat protein (TIGR03806 family)
MILSRPSKNLAILVACAAGLFGAACSDLETAPGGSTSGSTTSSGPPACVPSDGPLPHEKLSEYCFFKGDLKDLAPAEGVEPYQVAAALWSDHAAKQRLIALPKGKKIAFGMGENWKFPTGTVLVKTFSFYDDFRDTNSQHRIVETRLLILGDDGWTGHVYRWNDEQTEATRMIAGDKVPVTYVDEAGEKFDEEYIVPNTNQCKSCHMREKQMVFLGPFTQQLNRTITVGGEPINQLRQMEKDGLFDGALPPLGTLPTFVDPFGDAPVEDRARSYLHANCSHCHRPGGGAGPTGLFLLGWEKTPQKNGICKKPAAAGPGTGGHDFDIDPGDPANSIMLFRMSSTDPQVKMPQLPNRVPDKKGVALISEWVSSMKPNSCQ